MSVDFDLLKTGRNQLSILEDDLTILMMCWWLFWFVEALFVEKRKLRLLLVDVGRLRLNRTE